MSMAATMAVRAAPPGFLKRLGTALSDLLRRLLYRLGRLLVLLGWSVTLGSLAIGFLQTAKLQPAVFESQAGDQAGALSGPLQRALSLTLWGEAVFVTQRVQSGLEHLASPAVAAPGKAVSKAEQMLRSAVATMAASILNTTRDALAAIEAGKTALGGLPDLQKGLDRVPVLVLLVPLGLWMRRAFAADPTPSPGISISG